MSALSTLTRRWSRLNPASKHLFNVTDASMLRTSVMYETIKASGEFPPKLDAASILHIGCGRGALTSCLALEMAGSKKSTIFAVDRKAARCEEATANLLSLGPQAAEPLLTWDDLSRVIVMPQDVLHGDEDASAPGAPFHAIVSSVVLEDSKKHVDRLLKQLTNAGVLLAPIAIEGREAPELAIVARNGARTSLPSYKLDGAHVAQQGIVLSGEDEAVVAKQLGEREQLKKQLDIWKATFQSKNGRAPNRNDLMGDPHSRALFEKFSETTSR